MELTPKQKAKIRVYVLTKYDEIHCLPSKVRIANDGAVSVFVNPKPHTNQAGRIFAGWAGELLQEAENNA